VKSDICAYPLFVLCYLLRVIKPSKLLFTLVHLFDYHSGPALSSVTWRPRHVIYQCINFNKFIPGLRRPNFESRVSIYFYNSKYSSNFERPLCPHTLALQTFSPLTKPIVSRRIEIYRSIFRTTKRVLIRLPPRSEGVSNSFAHPPPPLLTGVTSVSLVASVYLTCSTRQHVSLNFFAK